MRVFIPLPLTRRGVVLSVVFALSLSLQGCLAAATTAAAAPIFGKALDRREVRRATNVGAIEATGRPMVDLGGGWQRRWERLDGSPLTATSAKPGESVRLVWTIPFGVNEGVGGVAITESPTCISTSASPTIVHADRAADFRANVEVWRMQPHQAPAGATGQMLDIETLSLFSDASLRAGVPGWVVSTPAPGGYRLSFAWEGASVQELQSVRPCITSWRGVPMTLLLEAAGRAERAPAQVVGRARTSSPGIGPRTVIGTEITVPAVSPRGEAVQTLFGREGGEENTTSEQGPFEKTGALTADVLGLFEIAMEVETGSRTLTTGAKNAMIRSRRDVLLQATQGEESAAALCLLVRRYGLDQRSLHLWAGETTVPTSLLGGRCSQSGAWMPKPLQRKVAPERPIPNVH